MRRNRAGKIFSLGLLLIYVVAAIAGLFVVLTRFTGTVEKMGPGTAVGDVQAATLAAYERADRKLFYLEGTAKQAVAEAMKMLYADQRSFFTQQQGDTSTGLECGSYGYQLWNTEEKDCLIDTNRTAVTQRILASLASKSLELLGTKTLAYPPGPFAVAYDALPSADGTTLSVHFAKQAQLEEPIYLGLPADVSSEELSRDLEGKGVVGGLLWPILGSGQTITSCFGQRSLDGAEGDHRGLDLRNTGDVIAAADGVVQAIGDVYNDKNGGAYIWIAHKDLSTRYLHLDPASITVKVGDTVKAGQVLGRPGLGLVVTPHLHFEVLTQNPPKAGLSFPVGSWYALNPACFYPKETIQGVDVKRDDDACSRSPGQPRLDCDAYGLTLTEPQAYSPGTAIERRKEGEPGPTTTQEPAVGLETLRPSNAGLTPSQAAKFQTAEQNRYKYGWDKYVVEASSQYGVDQALILGVITQESVGEPLAVGVGDAGLMQINEKTAPNLPPLEGSVTQCGCTNTRATPGSGCRCTEENDRRLRPEYAVGAAAWLLNDDRKRFVTYTDATRFMVAAYNTGAPNVLKAINAVGGDPSWNDVAAYLKKGTIISKENGAGVETYVQNVMAFATAWNGGAPIDAGHADAVERVRVKYGEVQRIGTFTYDPSLLVKVPDTVTPFLSLLGWADATLKECAAADIPGECLFSRAQQAKPTITSSCEEDPAAQYFMDLYQALRDCGENFQYDCQCGLPRPPTTVPAGTYVFSLDAAARSATLIKENAPVAGLSFPNISVKTLRVSTSTPEGVVPEEFTIALSPKEGKTTLSLTFKETGSTEKVEWEPGWSVEKGADPQQFVFRKDASGAGLCAPVKREYAFCSRILPDMPPVRFALTLKDEKRPEPVTGITYNPSTKIITFTSSSSRDVSFYNVYDQSPTKDTRPILQLRDKNSFDASAYAGKTLSVAAVDRAGNEGQAGTIAISAS